MIKDEVIEYCLAQKGYGKDLPGYPKVKKAERLGPDIFITLENNHVFRVEISSLPEELTSAGIEHSLDTKPLPDHTTMKDPEPETLEKSKRGKK